LDLKKENVDLVDIRIGGASDFRTINSEYFSIIICWIYGMGDW